MSAETTIITDQARVQAAFDRLKPLHQQLLLWDRVDGLSYAEMANKLGVSKRKLTRMMGDMIYAWCSAIEQEREHR